MIQNLNHASFGSHVIYTTKDESMRDALVTAGWEKPDIGDSFFDALTSIEAEVADERGPRFKVEDGQFMERCRIADDTEQGWHYGYESKELLVHKIGDFLDSYNLVVGEA